MGPPLVSEPHQDDALSTMQTLIEKWLFKVLKVMGPPPVGGPFQDDIEYTMSTDQTLIEKW